MSEANERNLNNAAAEAETNAELVQPCKDDDKENAPREESTPVEEKPKKKGKKKRRRKAAALALVALLVIVALVFGAVVGYGYGRSVGMERLQQAEAEIAELNAALENVQGMPVYNAFNEELSQENRSALDDLAGDAFTTGGDANVLLEEDVLGGPAMQGADEAAVVVAEYKGGQIMSDEAAREYSEQMARLVFAGYSEEEVAEVLVDEVLRYMVSDRVVEAHAREMGLFELSEEDRQQINLEAETIYAEQMDFYADFVNTEGMSAEEASGAVKAYMQEEMGVTLDGVKTELESSWWAEKLFDSLTEGVSIGEKELQAAYDALLKQQKEFFEASPADYEFTQMKGETIVYNLPGYRAVRMLLLPFENPEAFEAVSVLSEEILELNAQSDEEQIAAYRADIDSFYAPVEKKALEALEKIWAGADFNDMIAEMGGDEGMKDEALLESGYYIAENSTLWPAEVVSAAMGLEKEGDISGVIRVADGVCILQYVGEVPAGAVALDDVREALSSETLEAAKYSAYETQVNQWLEEVGAVYYPERMQ